ncbi:hypothetical protein PENSPDRAFT_415266 [Peniophora sp. CONT]|nr:hypothetical protein PENSPDRAFT_415266 [Peniophora sp. CONT]
MATPTFPWTEPLRLTFTRLDPGRTSVLNAGAPSPPIVFRSGHTTPSQTPSRIIATNVDLPGGLLWSSSNGQALPFGCSSTDSLSLEHVPPEPVESPAPPQPLYVVFPKPRRRMRFWRKKRKTYIVRGDGGAEPVATIVWPAFRPPRVEMTAASRCDPRHRPAIGLKRAWTRGRVFRETMSVLVRNCDGREYVWLLDEAGRGLSDSFFLELVPSRDGLPMVQARQTNQLATLAFEDDDPLPTQPGHFRRPRLDRAFLTVRAAEEDEEKIRAVCDLCVVSVLFLLAQMRDRLEPPVGGAPPTESPQAGPRLLLSPLRELYDMITLPLRPSLDASHHATPATTIPH